MEGAVASKEEILAPCKLFQTAKDFFLCPFCTFKLVRNVALAVKAIADNKEDVADFTTQQPSYVYLKIKNLFGGNNNGIGTLKHYC